MVQNGDKMQRIKKGVGTGDRWDMVRLKNGIIGYISQNYVEEIPDVEIEKIEVSLKDSINNIIYKGETKTLDVKIYPEEAKEKGIQGRVTLQITIDTKGRLSDVKVLDGVCAELDREAVRVVSMSPKWKPGIQRGRPVKVTYTFPVVSSSDKQFFCEIPYCNHFMVLHLLSPNSAHYNAETFTHLFAV